MNISEHKKQILYMFYTDGWRYLARDKIGYMHIFTEKPTKGEACWLCKKGIRGGFFFYDESFEDIRFENAEPLDIGMELGLADDDNA
ncbi:hypothetical protein HMPREF0872_00380 [Veillonella montpellierensis DNF00314]|uniref:Uncharacterized protein n=1 Tax=Veillonella montpellierensis DNF00314 TaxID=1401067 RepID=A0A096AN30_9FIRM|nr:hypothetical protein [Veillonella montpellierensis]KGF48096.1 hypothetical protein HMPREF0872_00380 [Veillonella montpellierensis DNF00314]